MYSYNFPPFTGLIIKGTIELNTNIWQNQDARFSSPQG